MNILLLQLTGLNVKLLLFISLFFITHVVYANSIDPQLAVAEHNKWRNQLNRGELGNQPIPNPYVSDMYWDQSLADAAQSHTDKCIWEHSGTGGENLYASTAGSIEEGIRLWVEEESDYHYSPIGALSNGAVTGHYTQVVWDSSLRIGCAKTQCNPIKNSDGSTLFNGAMYACQYRNSGNWIGQFPYRTSGTVSSKVEYTGANSNLNFQLLQVDKQVFRAKLKIKSIAPVVFEIISYEVLDKLSLAAIELSDAAVFKENLLVIPELSINGKNHYEAVLKYIGELDFELIEFNEH